MSSPTSSEQDYAVRYLYLELLAALKEKCLATSEPFTYGLSFALSGWTGPPLNNALKAKMEFVLYAHLQPVSHSARPLICPGVCFAYSNTLGGSHSERSFSNSKNGACRAELQDDCRYVWSIKRWPAADARLQKTGWTRQLKQRQRSPLRLGGRRILPSSTPAGALRSKNHPGNEVRSEGGDSSRPEVLPAM